VKTFLVGARPREAVFSSTGARAYVSAENGDTVSVIDTTDHKVVNTIELPRENSGAQLKPKGIVMSRDGQRIYVATIRVGDGPWGIAIKP